MKRCGTGSFRFSFSGASDPDGNVEGTYTIFPGSGTGDLAGITWSWRQTIGAETLDSWVRCKVTN